MSPIASTRPRFATPDWGASAETPLCFFEAPLNLSYARFSRPITTTRTVLGDLWLHENNFDGSRAYWLHKTLAFGPEQDRLCRIDDPSVVVVMGVSGCGKRTIASMLAHRLRALRRSPRVTVSFEFGLMTRIRGWGSLMVSTLDERAAWRVRSPVRVHDVAQRVHRAGAAAGLHSVDQRRHGPVCA